MPRVYCVVRGCIDSATVGGTYCEHHAAVCECCGKLIKATSKRCQQCAPKAPGRVPPEYNKAFRNLTAVQEIAELIRCYEDAWMRGFYPELCQRRMAALRAELEDRLAKGS